MPIALRSGCRAALAVAAAALLGACADATAPAGQLPAPESVRRAQVECTVRVAARTLSCQAPRPDGVNANLIIGGQGLHVRLTSENVFYAADDNYFSGDVRVQNLLDQPLGTDGSVESGVKVFFHVLPTVTAGTGTVEVLNPDGSGAFTGSDQPYFEYPGTIPPRGTSAPRTWGFAVPSTVETFVFELFVETPLPREQGVLHWRRDSGPASYFGSIAGMWAASPHDVFAVGDYGVVMHYDGNYWRALSTAGSDELRGVWGTSPTNLWVAGDGLQHFDGISWTSFDADPDVAGGSFNGIWASCQCNIWAVGDGGKLVFQVGGDWVAYGDPELPTENLNAIHGTSGTDIWAVGDAGTILHFDGASWVQVPSPIGAPLASVWAIDANDAWAVGDRGDDLGVVLHWNGTEWSEVTDPAIDQTLFSVWASAPNDVWVGGVGSLLHWNGDAWTQVVGGEPGAYLAIFGTSPGNVYAAGEFGRIDRWNGADWSVETEILPTLYGAFARTASDAWAVGEFTLLHYDGSGWSYAPAPGDMYAVWAAAANDAWAVGESSFMHFDGSDWTATPNPGEIPFYGVWGTSASDVIAVGEGGAATRWNGSVWTPIDTGTGANLRGVWGASAGDVFAVGVSGTIVRWNGAAWTPMTSGVTETLQGVWGSSPSDVYAVGDGGTVLHYDGNADGLWAAVATPADPLGTVYGVWGSGPADVFALADDGQTILHYDGTDWRRPTAFAPESDLWLYAVTGTSARDVIAVGDLGLIMHGGR